MSKCRDIQHNDKALLNNIVEKLFLWMIHSKPFIIIVSTPVSSNHPTAAGLKDVSNEPPDIQAKTDLYLE